MVDIPRPRFLHLLEGDGAVSSVCRTCHGFIAVRSSETDVREAEDAHKCRALNLGPLQALQQVLK